MKKLTFILMVFAMLFATNTFAQNEDEYENNPWISHTDVKGSKDFSLISRFQGSIIQYYNQAKWDKYVLPISKIEDDGKGGKTWAKKLDLAGEITRIQYSVRKDNNPAYVFMNYKDALEKAGWKILFSGCGDNELGNSSYEWTYYFYGDDGLGLKKFGDAFSPRGKQHCYIAAQYQTEDTTYYTAIYINDQSESPKGLFFTLITQDIIKVKNPDLGLVTAKLIEEKITQQGHITLKGIYFETGSATITQESEPALKNIAQYLNSHSDKKFFIVGHTDNTGAFDDNMTLSENRAKNVMNELITKFGVDANQLQAYGIANLAPVASNATDEGRAKNRRVELVEQ